MELALRQKILNDTGVSSIVSTKVYVPRAPHKTKAPYVVFQKVSTTRNHGMGADSKCSEIRVQLTCVETNYEKVKELSNAVHTCINRWRENGLLNGTLNVLGTYQLTERDVGPELLTGNVAVQMDYRIIFEEV